MVEHFGIYIRKNDGKLSNWPTVDACSVTETFDRGYPTITVLYSELTQCVDVKTIGFEFWRGIILKCLSFKVWSIFKRLKLKALSHSLLLSNFITITVINKQIKIIFCYSWANKAINNGIWTEVLPRRAIKSILSWSQRNKNELQFY